MKAIAFENSGILGFSVIIIFFGCWHLIQSAVMEKVYSNRLMISYLKLMDQKIGVAETDKVLEKIGLERLKLMDQSGFIGVIENDALVVATIEVTGEKDVGYVTGRNFSKNLGNLNGFILGATSPAFLMRTFGQVEERLALKTINKTTRLGPNSFQVDITFRDSFKERHFVCRNRIGIYEASPLFFGLPYAKVEHPACAFTGGDHCVYIVHFPEFGFSYFNRIFQFSTGLAICLSVFAIVKHSETWPMVAAAWTSSIGFLSYAIYRGFTAKKAMEWSLISNEGLTKQNLILENTNLQFNALQELTNLLNNSIRVQNVCESVVRMLVRDFHFGSSQIWLLDGKKEYLTCHSALGYPEDLRVFISNTKFKMGENWDNPYGLLVQTLEQKKTLIINNPEELYPKISAGTRDFLKALKISSFIITPLIHEENALGILAAEYHNGEKFENQDKLLFQSVSNSVANALVKADLFEQMAAKIDQRTKELEATSLQLMAAKEMAIQSEKLSSLGQMAAGVAHEINNPLNFLVNILPDVRRDVEGLEKIRELAAKGGLSGEIAELIKQVDEKYDLESHLAEKDFVFEKIQKALDKSTRIANSLKVFSRTSSKEKLAQESFAAMISEVIELIPQKVRGDTHITVEIPESLTWTVNKNEMEQAFLAIINNAIDAMEQKGKVEITGKRVLGDIVISFKDYGPGISEDLLIKIFNPFYTTKPPGKGTGLGLTIATEIVKKYGGVLTVESAPGNGSTFKLTFRE